MLATVLQLARRSNRLRQLRSDLRSRGLELSAGPLAVNVRALPRGSSAAPLVPDLEIIGGWLAATRPEIGFVQIGANDGLTNDPMHDLIHRYDWKGVLVEPQPNVFQQLQSTYADVDGLVLVNAAVGDERGELPFYYLEPAPGDPWFFAQVASFDRDHIIRHLAQSPKAVNRIRTRSVATVPLADIFAQAPRHVDILQIDAEGFDAKIVKSLNLNVHLPTVVRFEHRNLSPSDHLSAISHLRTAGYRFAINEDDTIAVLYEPGRGTSAIV